MAATHKGKKQERDNSAPFGGIDNMTDAGDIVNNEGGEILQIETKQPNPAEVLMLSNYVLVLRMPGQDASVTRHFREGQVVANPETIQQLIDNQAPIRYLS